ncbi:MAG: hypothetical protein KBT11_05910 [Treponema sp.]|nr:hypothetical protein [Candidatus Treponema equifaecale]
MGVSPLDLQTMYTNMNNIARTVANQQQGAQLAQQLQEGRIIQQNAEKANSVHKTADNEAKSDQVSDEGHQKQNPEGQKKRKDQDSEEAPVKKENVIRESYLGQHINIER